jgi:hypothetical protein
MEMKGWPNGRVLMGWHDAQEDNTGVDNHSHQKSE